MIELLHNQTTFSVISLNCQSIASKFDEFQYFMNYLLTHNRHIYVINIQETLQSNDTYYNDFTLPGYNMYFQPAICSTHGGLITNIRYSLNSTLHSTVYKHSTAWEAMLIDINQ